MHIAWTGSLVAFFLISLFVLGSAVMMLTLRKVVYMAMTIGGVFIGVAAVYILLGAEFVGVAQILIYAGAITILIMFAIMLTNHEHVEHETKWSVRNIASAIGSALLGLVLLWTIRKQTWPTTDLHANINGANTNPVAIGLEIFQNYSIPFELVSLLLIVALVGAVILAYDKKGDESHDE